MRLKRLGFPKTATLAASLLMVLAGIALSCRPHNNDAATDPLGVLAFAPDAVAVGGQAEATVSEQSRAVLISRSRETQPPGQTVLETQAGQTEQRSRQPREAAPAPRKPAPARRPAAPYSLPPFPPPSFATFDADAEAEAMTGPPPRVLWLSGVIEGTPKVALLRRDENRYLVSEGQTFENYRVVKIGSNSITIQRGSRKQTLRVGQY